MSHEASNLESCEKLKTIDIKFEQLKNLLKTILDIYLVKQALKKTITAGLIVNWKNKLQKRIGYSEKVEKKTIETNEKYLEQRKKVKDIVKLKIKQFYHKIIENQASKSHRKCFQLIKTLSGNERGKVQNLNQKKVNDFNKFFAKTVDNLNKKFKQGECSLRNQ